MVKNSSNLTFLNILRGFKGLIVWYTHRIPLGPYGTSRVYLKTSSDPCVGQYLKLKPPKIDPIVYTALCLTEIHQNNSPINSK